MSKRDQSKFGILTSVFVSRSHTCKLLEHFDAWVILFNCWPASYHLRHIRLLESCGSRIFRSRPHLSSHHMCSKNDKSLCLTLLHVSVLQSSRVCPPVSASCRDKAPLTR